jgi:hypothetical protein
MELDRREFLKLAAAGTVVGGLRFDMALARELHGKVGGRPGQASGYSSARTAL